MTTVIETYETGIYDDERASSLDWLRRATKGDNTMFASYAAIDPWALIFSGKTYLAITEGVHPHEPKVALIQKVLKSMDPEERRFAIARAKLLVAYGKAVEQAATGLAE